LSRWARRHKRLVGVATAFCLVAVCGFAISTILIAREKSKTEKNFRRAEGLRQHAHKTVDRFGAQLAEKLAKIHGAEELRREVLSDTLKYYRKFVDEAVDDVALQDDLAMTYGKMAMLIDQIGSTEESLRYHRKSIALSQSLVESAPKSLEYRQRLGLCHNNLAITLRRAGRVTEARQAYFDAIEVQRDSLDGGTSAIAKKITSDIVLSHTNLGLLQAETGEIHGAVSSFREAIRLQEGLLKNDSANPDLLRNLAATYELRVAPLSDA
jgi:tetratricopeptide (TPR) repeat protein